MRSILLVVVTVCVLGLAFGGYWMLQGRGGGGVEAAAASSSGKKKRAATTMPVASDSLVGPGQRVFVERYDQQTGALASRFRASRYVPQKDGRWLVHDPEAEFFLHNGQVMRLTGSKGLIDVVDPSAAPGEMPGRQTPRGGELQKVKIVLLPSMNAQRATMTLTLPNATFDNESFRISTEAYKDGEKMIGADRVPVKVRGDDYDFDGYGLKLQYNELDRRLEYLRIAHGERLLIKKPGKFIKESPAAGTARADGNVHSWHTEMSTPPLAARAIPGVQLVAADAAAAGEAVKGRKAKKDAAAVADDEAIVEREEPVYRAVFKDNVDVAQGGKRLAVGQDLIVDFLNREDESIGGVVGGNANPATRPARSATRPARSTTRPATRPARADRAERQARRNGGAATRPTTGPAGEPMEIKWTGPLTITPLPGDRPERIAPGESIVRITSGPKRPVEVTKETEGGMSRIRAGTLTHWTIDQGVQLEEGPGVPVEMTDPRGSHIVTQMLTFSEREGTALLQGRSRARLPVADEADPAKRELMDVEWTDRCLLHLEGADLQAMAIRRADLQGKVAVNHPQLVLVSDALQLHFDEASPATRPAGVANTDKQKEATPPLRQLDATGNVHCVMTRPDQTKQTLDCQTLKLLTDRTPQGQLYAKNVVALGQVHAVDPKQDLRAGYVSVSLAAPAAKGPATRPSSGDMLPGELESMVAHENVRVKTVDGKQAEADQLIVEVRDGAPTATLHGRPARVKHERNTLVGDVIQMMPNTQQISIPGPGRMEGMQKKTAAGEADRPVEVTWEKAMRADGRSNQIECVGGVVAKTVGADGAVNIAKGQTARIATTRPVVTAAKPTTGAAGGVAVAKPAARAAGDMDVMADHEIQSILLQDEAQVTSILTESSGERMFHVTSASIRYDKGERRLTIPQAGQMLFADTRPPAKDASAQAAAQDPFAVKGKTAFSWAEGLVYDEAAGQVTMSGGVVVARVDQNSPGGEPMRLEAQKVIADLEPSDSATTRPAAQAQQPQDLLSPRMQMKYVRATGGVAVLSRSLNVEADSLDFDPVKHLLTVRAAPGRRAVQRDEKGLEQATFDELIFNTETSQVVSWKNPLFRARRIEEQTGQVRTPPPAAQPRTQQQQRGGAGTR